MRTREERRRLALPCFTVACGLLLTTVFPSLGCGGQADDAPEPAAATPFPGAAGNTAPVRVPARATAEPAPPGAASGGEAELTPAIGLPIPDGVPAPVRAILDDPPQQLDEAQFSSLLDHYCVSCHTTPACSAACDGFFFDDWQDLAAGGNAGPDSIDRLLARVVGRIEDGSMPPALGGEIYDLPAVPRARMVEFIENELDGLVGGR